MSRPERRVTKDPSELRGCAAVGSKSTGGGRDGDWAAGSRMGSTASPQANPADRIQLFTGAYVEDGHRRPDAGVVDAPDGAVDDDGSERHERRQLRRRRRPAETL